MGNGIQRLKDHNKRKPKVELSKETVEKIEAMPLPKAAYPTAGANVVNFKEKTQKKSRKNTSVKAEIPPFELSASEKRFFDAIFEQVRRVHGDDSGNFILAAANLAKLYANHEKFEKEIADYDGNMVLEDPNGRLYANPAVTMLQRNQHMITANLKILGFTPDLKKKPKTDEDVQTISEFAQFQ